MSSRQTCRSKSSSRCPSKDDCSTISLLESKVSNLRETERAWLAGIIDGEGSIHITKTIERRNKSGFAFHPQLSITNTNVAILSNVKRIAASGSICRSISSSHPAWKDKYSYTANSKTIRTILPEVLPYLIGKRKQALLLLKFLSLVKPSANSRFQRTEEMHRLYERLRNLNRKGKQE